LFNQIYNQESLNRQSGVDNDMVLEIVKQRYKNRTGDEFKCFHWWKGVRYQPKWRARSDAPSTVDAFVSSSEAEIEAEAGTEEEVNRPIGRDRAKMVTRKGKGKECSSSQNRYSFTMGGIMLTLKKLGTSFTRAQM
jgi:hypothetical protein